ncbi:tRNA preQ1(34) S-adenosylmethionine ribosyltransferase-isomerase QueA [Borreliella californiensis]|uniref:S-adenosylmethionine:tRNA ribosyltransferase-isomerase n=1 Tax=Borreliella californiensis TaxID=373543 RepID=A0A7W9ZND7_9SPIR|nr:tRNA preQ1(34) S-adenosylmethionine ribosyltransferase-isomerase QueA [Borreliella californiensis]MBB6213339.1 S-adenosylmethionine:tRNA ribosyltransferase-isomerase [Borreliella californiensis]WKC91346.1 tRNA preQ1(34) S-adenosylmethionine ribosyltransferase-isomerase QueA [Borreliella californiensis]WNY70100.1 tRNA preQ1(34) S-adenosylmethionine ribosyltransferase-isomerase QueA [Borreliella californiensis]
MKTKEFHFNLPYSLIAQYPSEKRGSSRLMVLDPKLQKIYHEDSVNNILKYINSDIFIVFNNSKVRKSRMYAESDMGSNVEFLILDRIDTNLFTALISKSKKQIVGNLYKFPEGLIGKILSKNSSEIVLKFDVNVGEDYFEKHGFVPIPPYIKRDYDKIDEDRYQTVYSKYVGSAASATAGLHFSRDLFFAFERNNIEYDFITLHVGLGTFLPVRSKKVEEHNMHFETFLIKDCVAKRLQNAKFFGKKILSIGTTTLRALEASYDNKLKKFKTGQQSTNLFIYPGKNYCFKFVDMLFTNFHTPQSTLLMLVSSFAGKDFVFSSYEEAINTGYKFFSYGDAMLVLNHI